MPTPGTHRASAKQSLSVICCLFGKTASPTTTGFHISLVEEAVPLNALIHFSLFFHLWHCERHLLWGLPRRPGRMAGRGCLWPSASGGGSAKAKGRAHTAAAAAPLPPVPTGLWFAEQPDAAAKREHHAVKFICGYGASTARKSPQRYSQLIISTACDGSERCSFVQITSCAKGTLQVQLQQLNETFPRLWSARLHTRIQPRKWLRFFCAVLKTNGEFKQHQDEKVCCFLSDSQYTVTQSSNTQ